MVTNKSPSPRSRSSSRTSAARSSTRTSASDKADGSIVAHSGRTITQRPSAAIVTGAVAFAAAAAAGAFFFSRRDKSTLEPSERVSHKVMGSFADAKAKIKDLISSDHGRSQQQIAEEALTLKKTGGSRSPIDALASDQIKAGSVAY